ncbi:MAG TPA: glycosyltransferase, partial [Solirubrobacteraceae bacterium]|nr:glycosyltransferase [Solirubrobacteraceae bacterium]
MPAEPVPVVCVPAEGTFGAAVNAAGRAAGRAPVVVLEPGVAPPAADALERLRAAAAETTVATASALRHGLHVPDGVTPEQAAERAQRLRPRIADPVPGAVLLTRAALDLAGPLDEDERSPAAILAEFGERCLARGLSHVLADDVLVPGTPAPMTDAEAAALAERFPHRAVAARAFAAAGEPVERALAAVRVGAAPLTVTIDGRALGPYRAGTQVHLLELVAALARTGRAALRVVVAHDLAPDAAALFAREPAISTISYEEAANGSPEPTEVVHRPSQVFTPDDLALLVPLGERLVVTHQDLIAYRSPAYHRHAEDWARLRTTTRLALGSADRVAFFSRHALEDALAEDLVEPARAAVVPIGVDHHVAAAAEPAAPEGFDPAVPYLLCLGADLPHKNHGFAVALLDALRGGGWAGRLVLAGPRADDHEPLAHEHVAELGSVSEAEKAFLLANAAAVAYPTLYEGFGLVPFEAGAAGVPCAFAPVASLAEVLPRELAVLVPWDAEASAAALRPLL